MDFSDVLQDVVSDTLDNTALVVKATAAKHGQHEGAPYYPKTIGKSSINGGFNSWKINYKWWKTYVYIDVEWSLLTRKLQIILEAIWVFRIILHVYPRVTINT